MFIVSVKSLLNNPKGLTEWSWLNWSCAVQYLHLMRLMIISIRIVFSVCGFCNRTIACCSHVITTDESVFMFTFQSGIQYLRPAIVFGTFIVPWLLFKFKLEITYLFQQLLHKFNCVAKDRSSIQLRTRNPIRNQYIVLVPWPTLLCAQVHLCVKILDMELASTYLGNYRDQRAKCI